MTPAASRPRFRRLRTGATAAFAALVASAPLPGADLPLQPFQVSHLDVEPGLSHNWVLSIAKDPRGFLWVGTQNGLNRFDGAALKVYRYSPSDPRSLPSSVAGVLYVDRRGRLWVGSSWGHEGVALYDSGRDDFTRFPAGAQESCLRGADVRAMLEAPEGRLWVGTDAGVCLLDPDTGTDRLYPLVADRGDVPLVYALSAGEDGRLFVGGGAGLFSLDPKSGRYDRWDGDAPALDRVVVRALLPDGPRGLFVATREGLYQLDLAKKQSRHYVSRPDDPDSLSVASLAALARDPEGRIFIGTQNGGLECFDPQSGRFLHHRPDIEDERSLGSGSVASLHVDDQGIVWIGTYDVGLNFISPYEQAFRHLKARPLGLSSSRVGSVLEDREGNLWIGTNGSGLDRLEAATGRWRHYRHDDRDPRSLGSNAILALLEAADGTIWVGGWGAGFARLDPKTGQVRSYRHDAQDPNSLANDNVWQILELKDGALLVTTQGGAFTFDRRTERFTRLSRPTVAGGDDWYGAAEDSRGDVWIGGVSGVQHVDRTSGEVHAYRADPDVPRGIGPGWVMAVHVDRRGDVWIGTESGLVRFTRATGAWDRFTVADGLGHDTVMGILEDDEQRLWVSTIRGITRVESHGGQGVTPHFFNFESRDGLTNTFFTRGAAFRGPSGRFYFGGGRGLTHFLPAEVRANSAPPPVVFTGLRILNTEARPGVPGSPLAVDIAEAKEVTLSHRDATVTFEFAALNMVLPHKNRYAYRLEGFEDHWNEVGGQRFATYTSLPPGTYTLQVRAANDDGVWNEEGARLRVTVLPPFYRSLWFRLLVLAGLGAGLAFAHRWRVERIRDRARELEAKVEERTREVTAAHAEALAANAELEAFAYSVSHDLRAPLRSVDGFSRILSTDYGERLDEEGRRLLGLVRGSAQRMGRLIDDLLGFSRLGRQGLKVETVDMERLVREAWEELHRDLPAPPVLEVGALAPASGDGAMIRQVVTNLLSNAAKFSAPVAAPRVEVSSQPGDRENEYTVRDNGVGFDMRYAHKLFGVFQRLHSLAEFDGTGVGLAIVERVVRRHGGRVWAESEEGKGAAFHFSLPRPAEAGRAAEPATAFADRLRPGP